MKHKLVVGVLLGMLLSLTGCKAVAVLWAKLAPPPTTYAKYKLGTDPAVVLVENSQNPASGELDALQITALMRADLTERKSAVLVEEGILQRLRDKDPAAFRKMSITEIGRAVGAKQVVYIDLQKVSVEVDTGGQMVRGSIEATARVVDTRTGANRWPTDVPQGMPVAFETPYTEVGDQTNDSRIRRALHDRLVLTVGRCFRDWVPANEGD